MGEDKSIELIEKELDEVKKHLNEKEIEIKNIDDKIRQAEMKIEADIRKIQRKHEVIEKDLRDVKKENESMKENISVLRNKIEYLKVKLIKNTQDMNNDPNEVIEEESVNADSEKDKDLAFTCDKCEFVAKSEGGLKTHKTVKHNKTVSLRAYTKVTR